MRHGLDQPVLNDADFQVWQEYAVKAWPTLMLIDPQGKIVYTQSGEILAEDYVSLISELIVTFEARGELDRTPLDLRSERMIEPLRPLNYPAKLLLGSDKRLFIADTGHHRILEVQLANDDGPSGEILRVFGNGQAGLQDGSADEAMFHAPHGMALSRQTLYVTDTENHAIRAIDLDSGEVRTVAGTGRKAHGYLEQGGPTEVSLRSPWALWVEETVLLIAMAGSHQIWALVGEERLGIFAGNGREALVDGPLIEASFNQPSDIDVGFGHLFIADSEASAIRAISMGQEAQVMTLIGQGLFEFGDIDGTGGMVRLQHPTGLTFYDGLIYIADSYNHKIKALDPTTAQVVTLIGTGRAGHRDGSFAEAELFEPEGVIADEDRLYIADTNNHLIRVADLKEKTVHTLMLGGLERLASTAGAEKMSEAIHLEPLTVGTGEVEIALNITLPEGYKLNTEAPQMLQLVTNSSDAHYTFGAAEPPKFTINVMKDDDLDLELTLYYCQTADQRLCMIYNTQLILPLIVNKTGEKRVEVPVQVPLV